MSLFYIPRLTVPKVTQKLIKYHSSFRCYSSFNCNSSIGIIGAPFSKGQHREGPDRAPIMIRDYGIVKQFKKMGYDVKDYGDLRFETNPKDNDKSQSLGLLKNPYTVGDACRQLANGVTQIIKDGRIPITIGGDHSLAVGTVSGHANVNDIAVLWIDAHADINTAMTTKTGNIHGMPVSFIIKEIAQKFNNPNANCPGFGTFTPSIGVKNLAFIGLRDVDDAENHILKELNICHYTMKDIDKLGIYEVISRALDQINGDLKRAIHVSFDIDSIDDCLTPSTGTPVPGGLTLREAFCIGEEIAKTKLLRAFDIVEVNPLIGSDSDVQRTINYALNITLSFFGKRRNDLYVRDPRNQHYHDDI